MLTLPPSSQQDGVGTTVEAHGREVDGIHTGEEGAEEYCHPCSEGHLSNSLQDQPLSEEGYRGRKAHVDEQGEQKAKVENFNSFAQALVEEDEAATPPRMHEVGKVEEVSGDESVGEEYCD